MKNHVLKNNNISFIEFIKAVSFLIMIYLLFLLFYFGSSLPILGNKISKNITQNKIELLYIGMTKSELIDIIKEPFQKYSKRGMYYLLYSQTGIGLGAGEIEIYMYIKNNKLQGIHMEFDDRIFYNCSNKKCSKVVDKYLYDKIIPMESKSR